MSRTGEHYLYKKIPVYVHQYPEDVDVTRVFSKVEKYLPERLLEGVDVVYIGDFDFLRERSLNALYEDGGIYILPDQDDEQDMYDDIVHEIAHAVEGIYQQEIYADGSIEREFLLKRKKLLDILSQNGYDVGELDFFSLDYDEEFDEFLYKEVGYNALRSIIIGIFMSPYGATSLREYFANCFEYVYAYNKANIVSKISPRVYAKILSVHGG